MTREEKIQLLTDAHVLQTGHFRLTSGRHSDKYMQCARVFENARYSEVVCRDIADAYRGERIDLVVGPALGGIIITYEVARQLGTRNIFAERENGTMTLRRGFAIEPGTRVLVVEDTITTGGSVREVIDLVREKGGVVVGVGSVVRCAAARLPLDGGGVLRGGGLPALQAGSPDYQARQPQFCEIVRLGHP